RIIWNGSTTLPVPPGTMLPSDLRTMFAMTCTSFEGGNVGRCARLPRTNYCDSTLCPDLGRRVPQSVTHPMPTAVLSIG
ncbi:MAG: hypothetical protein ACXVCV_10230, partial [Polyangia bacterium]